MQIRYLKGDATSPIVKPAIIVHVCNDIGAWGAGFVLALSQKWNRPEKSYRDWFQNKTDFGLGSVQFVPVEPALQVANMIAQHNVGIIDDVIPLRYDALRNCLNTVYTKVKNTDQTVHMPRIGCGRAGGDWDKVEIIIGVTMTVDTYVYDF